MNTFDPALQMASANLASISSTLISESAKEERWCLRNKVHGRGGLNKFQIWMDNSESTFLSSSFSSLPR